MTSKMNVNKRNHNHHQTTTTKREHNLTPLVISDRLIDQLDRHNNNIVFMSFYFNFVFVIRIFTFSFAFRLGKRQRQIRVFEEFSGATNFMISNP